MALITNTLLYKREQTWLCFQHPSLFAPPPTHTHTFSSLIILIIRNHIIDTTCKQPISWCHILQELLSTNAWRPICSISTFTILTPSTIFLECITVLHFACWFKWLSCSVPVSERCCLAPAPVLRTLVPVRSMEAQSNLAYVHPWQDACLRCATWLSCMSLWIKESKINVKPK